MSCLARSRDKRAILAVFYDEAARRTWAERSYSGDVINFEAEAAKVSDAVLLKAEALYDEAEVRCSSSRTRARCI